MFRIRESFRTDVDQIFEVAKHLDTVNLPANREHLVTIVEHSQQSFDEQLPLEEREFLFVLEDTDTKRIIGTSMIHAQHGTRSSPHVFFRLSNEERYSETLDRYMVHQCLQLGYNYNGPTGIGGLILLPDYRRHEQQLGKVLSYTRFLFIAMKRALFRDNVLSELLPPLEADGTSRLWTHLGKRFTGLTYQEADLLSKRNKEFIRSLFPHTRIYTSLFPDAVREVVGQVGPETRGVEKILRRIGFEYANTIDPFDGGPHFVAKTDSITLVKDSRTALAQIIKTADNSRPRAILAVQKSEAPLFRAACSHVVAAAGSETVGIPRETAELIGVSDGDQVWMVPL